jgi:class 3 adenylate cyclase
MPTPAPVTAVPARAPGSLQAARAYTPQHLAVKILTSRSALQGERKQVTVLFADVAGFTTLAEQLDPEVVHEIINRCFECLTTEVHRFEGTINQYMGDGGHGPLWHSHCARRQSTPGVARRSRHSACYW